MRVLLADPPAYTPPYDHALAAALARAGATVELLTSRFRYGAVPAASGYTVRMPFYPVSSRAGGRLRLAVKAVEHPLGMAALAARTLLRADVLHLQWLAFPEVDRVLLRSRRPLVFTAHDLLPRRTAHRPELWRDLFRRFDRIVVHSERGRWQLAEAGVELDRLRVIPHAVFRSEPPRRDDGATVLALGTIREYKGLPDAAQAVLRLPDVRLLVAGDPRIPLGDLRELLDGRAEWRLGWLGRPEIEAALAEATIAVFPYKPELDQSGALLEALGAGVPAVVYDVGGLGETVSRYGAGRVVPAGDVEALAAAMAALLGDPAALAAAREGAERARSELTWEAAAVAHLNVYRELT